MAKSVRRFVNLFVVVTATVMLLAPLAPRPAGAADAEGIDRDVSAALDALFSTTPEAKTLAGRARGILVFPNIVKAGFLVGAQYGEGSLLKNNKTAGYYNIAAASYGLQAGIQGFGYALVFMTDSALDYLNKSGGFEIGSGPSIVVVDAGKAKTLSTSTIRDDIYAFTFGQKGLMAGLGLQGSKITRISP